MLQTSSSAFFSFSLFSCAFERLKFLRSSRWDGIHFRPTLTFITAACCTFSRHSGHSGEWRRKSNRDSAAAKRKKELMALFCMSSIWCTERGRTSGFWGRSKHELWEIFICTLNNKMVHLNRPFLKASHSLVTRQHVENVSYLIPPNTFYFCC